MTDSKQAGPQPDPLAAWVDTALAVVTEAENLHQRLSQLDPPTSALPPAERLQEYLRLWRGLNVNLPTPARVEARAVQFTIKMDSFREHYKSGIRSLVTTTMKTLEKLMNEVGAATVGLLRHADFGRGLRTRDGLVYGNVALLPPGHFGKTLLADDDLYVENGSRFLVLGDPVASWYQPEVVKRNTLNWREEQRRQADEQKRRDMENYQKVRQDYAEKNELKLLKERVALLEAATATVAQ